MMSEKEKRIWIVTDNKAGMLNQSIGLAEAMGYPYEIKNIGLKSPWTHLSPFLRPSYPFCQSVESDKLQPPWPDIILTCGRQSILPALYVKSQSQNKAFLVKIQRPMISADLFDLIVTPSHDHYKRKNVYTTLGSLHHVSEARKSEERLKWHSKLSGFSSSKYAVLIGGNSKAHMLTPRSVNEMMQKLRRLAIQKKATLFVTVSRRTPEICRDIIKASLEGISHVYFDGGPGDNPYIAFLSYADTIFVTEDSVSMVSEALSTGKPVYLLKMEGGSEKFTRFHDMLLKRKYIRYFEGDVDYWTYPPLRETEEVAAYIKGLLE